MSRDSILVMLLAAQFFAPFLLALLFSRRSRTSPAESSGHMAPKGVTGKDMAKKSMAPPQHGDWPLITEFAYRRDYFRRWVIAGAFGSVVLGLAGMYLSVIGVLFLCPLYGALMHLRCPGCDATTTVKGVTDGNYCRRCGQLLRL
jgi:hypothetical protein